LGKIHTIRLRKSVIHTSTFHTAQHRTGRVVFYTEVQNVEGILTDINTQNKATVTATVYRSCQNKSLNAFQLENATFKSTQQSETYRI